MFIIKSPKEYNANPYQGPACVLAKVVKGKVYLDKKEAYKDARKLSKYAYRDFEVREIEA